MSAMPSAVIELHGRLSEWNDLERRLLNESASRIHQFERSLQHEWKAIQQKHEEPLQRLNEQAQRVTETCLTAIDSAVQGFGRAEARLAAIEQHLHQEFGDLSREVREAVAELRQTAQAAPQTSLGVRQRRQASQRAACRRRTTRRRDVDVAAEGRRQCGICSYAAASGLGTGIRLTGAIAPRDRRRPRPDDSNDHASARAPVPEPHNNRRPRHPRPRSGPRQTRTPAALMTSRRCARLPANRWLIVGAVLLGLAAIAFYVRMESRVQEASLRASAAERGVSETREAAREQLAEIARNADSRVASAQQAAQSAQMVASIVSAPDAAALRAERARAPPVRGRDRCSGAASRACR